MPLTEAYVRSRIKAVREKALSIAYGNVPTIDALKNEGGYRRQLRRLVRQLHNGRIDLFQFNGRVTTVIERQYAQAWNRGARDVGFKPRNMTTADDMELRNLFNAEVQNVLSFSEAIEQARLQELPVDEFISRVDLWANRFNEVENDARIYFGAQMDVQPHIIWRLGRTEQHCDTCAGLDGVVATPSQWIASGYKPQSAPNAQLECGGWRCDCGLKPTDAPLTEGGIPSV